MLFEIVYLQPQIMEKPAKTPRRADFLEDVREFLRISWEICRKWQLSEAFAEKSRDKLDVSRKLRRIGGVSQRFSRKTREKVEDFIGFGAESVADFQKRLRRAQGNLPIIHWETAW